MPVHLATACQFVNDANAALGEPSNNCIAASLALAQYLQHYGHAAQVARVCATIYPPDRQAPARCIGWDGDGSRPPAAHKGMWNGHLAVESDGYLLDPTADQCNDEHISVPPLVLPLPRTWGQAGPAGLIFTTVDDVTVRYLRFHRQNGWKSAGAARPSAWRPILDAAIQSASGAMTRW